MKARRSISSMAKLVAAVSAGAVSLLLAGCFYMPGVSGGSARAGLVLPKYIAANTASLALVVGGPGMNPIYASYPVGTTSATLNVPSGVARTFTLLANTPSVTFQGAATVDLQPGETKEITLEPALFATQIIVPDNLNGRLVQISDMKGTGWTTFPPVGVYIYPNDVDFDGQGRIYIANYSSPGIVSIKDITDTNWTQLTGVTGTYIRSIAMDRAHGLLYYTDGYNLWRIQVTPTIGAEELIDLSSQSIYVSNVKGIAVDPDGFVYIASNPYPTAEIMKINPNPAASPTLVRDYNGGAISFAFDVLVNGDFIYVSDSASPKIVRFSKDLELVDSFPGPGSDPFLGPERFVAILNKPITVVDQPHDQYGNSTTTDARLVSFLDMTGAGWTTYGSYGAGQDQFEFYNSYQY